MIRRCVVPTLGLGVTMLSLMFVGLGSAQGETGANWMVNGANVSSTLAPHVRASEVENSSFVLHFRVAGALNEVLCTSMEILQLVYSLSGVLLDFDIDFDGCVDLIEKKLSIPCKPRSSGQPAGKIRTNTLKGLLVLHEGKGLVRIAPKTGETLATLLFNVAEGCALPESVPIKGVFYVKDSKGEEKTELVTHLVEQGPLTHIFAISDTAEHAANVNGSVLIALSGAHEGLKWSGLPA